MLGWSALAFGQGSQRLSYSGRLASSAGVPVNGTVNLTIELYRNAASVCSQSIAGVVLANGVFNVELDFPANCTGALTWVQTLQAAHTAGDNMFIEVTDDTNSVTYPQQLLTSVPFAGVALNTNIPNNFITSQMLGSMSASAGQVLQFNGASWGPVNAAGGGTVTSVAAGTGLDGGTITGAGTIGIANGGVDTAQLSTDAVTTIKITDANVTTAKLANSAVTSGKIADDAVTLAKIANGSAGGQVMKWDGSNWQLAADADSGGDITGVTAGAGLDGGGATGAVTLSIGNDNIVPSMIDLFSEHFDASTTSLILKLATNGGIESTGAGLGINVDGTTIQLNGSGELEVVSASVSPDALAQQGASSGQVLKWSGTAWVPSNDLSGGGGGSGGDTASDSDVILNADNDSNGSGDVILQTRNLDRFKVTSIGHVETGSQTQFTIKRAAPTVVGDAIELGSFFFDIGQGFFEIVITGGAGGVSYSKVYQVPVDYDGPITTWYELIPQLSSNPYNGNDVTIDVYKPDYRTYQFRLRRTSGVAAHTATISYRAIGSINAATWTDNSATSSPGAPSEYFVGNSLFSEGGLTGVNTVNPVATLDVNGEIRVGSTTALACAAGTAGTLRYNSTSNKVEFCDGTSFAELGAGASASVTASDIQDNTITTIKIADGAITLDKISTASGNSGLQAVQASTGERNWLTASATAGMMVFNTDTAEMEVYTGSAWVPIGADSVGLDDAYDGAGAGTGRSVTVDAGAVEFNGAQALNEVVNINNSQNGGVLRLTNTGTGSTLYIEDEANDDTPFVVTADGRVGVGTDTPNTLVEIDGANAAMTTMEVNGNGTSVILDVNTPAGNGLTVNRFGQATINGASSGNLSVLPLGYTLTAPGAFQALFQGLNNAGYGGLYIDQNNTSGYGIYLDDGNSNPGFVVRGDGYVGVGTHTPSTTVDVVGAIKVASTTQACDADLIGAVSFDTNTNTHQFCDGTFWQVAASGAGGAGTASLDAAYDDGNVITADAGAVQVNASGAGEGFRLLHTGTGSVLYIEDEANDATPFVISANGNVGIGTDTPSAQLLTLDAGANNYAGTYYTGWNNTSSGAIVLEGGTGNFYYDAYYATGGHNFRVGGQTALRVFDDQSVTVGSTTQETSAVLNLESWDKGFLPPRMETASKNAIISPTEGLIVFDTDLQKLSIWEGTKWTTLNTASETPHIARMEISGTQSIPNSSDTKIDFDTVVFDTGGIASATNGLMYIEHPGYYFISVTLMYDSINNGDDCYAGVQVNGTLLNKTLNNSDGNDCQINFQTVTYLDSGDTINAIGRHNHGSNRNLDNVAFYKNEFVVAELIGNLGGGGGGSVGPGTVTATEIATDAVGSDELADDAVDTAAVADGAITIDKLSTASGSAGLTITNATTGAREGMSATAGMMVYNTETNQLEVYNGTDWVSVGSGGGGGSGSGSVTLQEAYEFGNTITASGNAVAITASTSTEAALVLDGRLGVGTSTPSATAHINSGAGNYAGIMFTGLNNARSGQIQIEGGTGYMYYDSGLDFGGHTFRTKGGGHTAMSITNEGNIGIGVLFPAATSSLTVMGVTNIGNQSASATLNVNGEARLGDSGATCDATTEGNLRTSSTTNQLEICNGSAWTAFATAGGTDMDTTYDAGGAGLGRSVTVDSGAIQFTGANAADEVIEITQSQNGGGLLIEDTGTGIPFRVNDQASDTTPFVIDSFGRVGVSTLAPTTAFDVSGTASITGNMYTSGVIYMNGTTTDRALYESKYIADSNGTGWRKVARLQTTSGRGQARVTIYTVGGAYTPRSVTVRFWHDWTTGAGMTVLSEGASNVYWTEFRVTHDGTYSYLEANYAVDINSHIISVINEAHAGALGYEGVLPGTSGTVHATAVNARLQTGSLTVAHNDNVGVGTMVPDTSALLDVSSTNKGFLPPRMTTAQKGAIATPADGLVVYDTDLDQLQVYNGSAWVGSGAMGTASLDSAYDDGNVIAADSGAVTINATGAGGGLLIEDTGTGIPFRVNDAASDSSPFVIDAEGRVGIGTATPFVNSSIHHYNALTDQTWYAHYNQNIYTSATDGTYYQRGNYILNDTRVNTGVTNSGFSQGQWVSSMRGYNAVDAGTLATLYGQTIFYGHYTNGQDSALTNNAYGIYLSPYALSGSITNAYDLYINAGSGSITDNITNHYGLYIGGAQKENYIAGSLWVNNDSRISGSLRYFDYYTVSDTVNPTFLGYKNGALDPLYIYRVSLSVASTGTNTGASFLLWYDEDNTDWKIRTISMAGMSSNHPELFMDAGVPKIRTWHATGYPVFAQVEAQFIYDTDATIHTLGSDAHWQRFGNELSYEDGEVVIGASQTQVGSAILELNSTTKGFLPPRMTGGERDSIGSASNGLVIYNTTTEELNVYNGTAWAAVGSGGSGSASIAGAEIEDGTISIDKLSTASGSAGLTITNATTGARDGMTATAGMMIYNTETNQLEVYNGTEWGAIQGGTSSPTNNAFTNLDIRRTSATTLTITATKLGVQDALISDANTTVDITSSGANGLDTGSEASSTWYYVWALSNSSQAFAGMISTSSETPTMPSGYDKKRLLGAIYNNSSSDLIVQNQVNDRVVYSDITVLGYTSSTSWIAVDISAAVPPEARRVDIRVYDNPQAGNWSAYAVCPSNVSGKGCFHHWNNDHNLLDSQSSGDIVMFERQRFWYLGGGSPYGSVSVQGYSVPYLNAGSVVTQGSGGGSGDGHSLNSDDNSVVDAVYVDSSGDVGIGTTTPSEKLEVNGAIKIGTTTNTNAGTIRYSGGNFEGHNGTSWLNLNNKGLNNCSWVSDCFNGCGGSDSSPNADVACPAGKTVISGSCSNGTTIGYLVESRTNGNGWLCEWRGHDGNCGCVAALCCDTN